MVRNIVWASLILFSRPTFGRNSCHDIFERSPLKTANYLWTREHNPDHWEYVQSELVANLPKAIGEGGIVAGDWHVGNINLVFAPKPEARLVDIDDIGIAPFVGDPFRLYDTVNKLSLYITAAEIVRAYSQGLNNRPVAPPKFLKKRLGQSNKSFKEKKSKFIEKLLEDGKFEIPGSKKLTALSDMPREMVDLQFEVQRGALSELQKKFGSKIVILDAAFRTKTIGGAKGLPRFVFAVKGPFVNGIEIFEFKNLLSSASDVCGLLSCAEARVQRGMEVLWEDRIDPRYGFLHAGGKDFWMRPIDPDWLDLDELIEEHPKHFYDFVLWAASEIGRLHGRQSSKIYKIAVDRYKKEIAKQFEVGSKTLGKRK